MVLSVPNSELAPISKLGPNTKYLYQDPLFNMNSDEPSPQKRQEMRDTVAISYLSLIFQRDAVKAESMFLILLNVDDDEVSIARGREEVKKTLKPLNTQQKRNLIFCSGSRDVDMKATNIDLLVVNTGLDDLEGHHLALDLDTLYKLHSKAGLSSSVLPRYV